MLSDRIERDELVRLVAQRTGQYMETVNKVVDAFQDEIYQAMKRGQTNPGSRLGYKTIHRIIFTGMIRTLAERAMQLPD